MKRLEIRILTIILFAFCLSACHKSVEFEKVDQQKTVYYKDSTSCSIDIQFLYPSQFKNNQVLGLVQQEIISAVLGERYKTLDTKKAVDAYIENTVNEFLLNKEDMDASAKANAGDEDLLPMLYNEEWVINTAILYNEKNLLSYAINNYSYTGGAHGLETTTYLMMDMKTGKKIEQKDIFIDGSEKSIGALLKAQIMKDKKIKTEKKLIEDGYIFHEEIKANGNFYVDESGIHYIFAPYEIAAYVVGETEVVLSFDDVKPFLRKDSPIKTLF